MQELSAQIASRDAILQRQGEKLKKAQDVL